MKFYQKENKGERPGYRLISMIVMLVITFCAIAGFNSLAGSLHLSKQTDSTTTAPAAVKIADDPLPAANGVTQAVKSTTAPAASKSDAEKVPAENRKGKWIETKDGWSYLDVTGGIVHGGWVYEDGIFYYINAAGIMEYDEFRRIGDCWYHLGESGAMDIGRFQVGDKEYFTNESGALYMNTWVSSDDSWYYCDDIGAVCKNTMTPDGYYVDAAGRLKLSAGARFEGFLYQNGGNHELYLNLGTADIIWDYLKNKGWTGTAIAGLLGNFQQESGMSPTLEEAGNHIGYGLGQWSYDRRTALSKYAAREGKSIGNIYLQLDFLCEEAGEKNFVNTFARTNWSSPSKAAIEWGTKWERYNLSDRSMGTVRIPYAEAYYAHYVNGVSYMVSSTRYTEETVMPASLSDADADTEKKSAETETNVESTGTASGKKKTAEEAGTAAGLTAQQEASHVKSAGTKVIKASHLVEQDTSAVNGPGTAKKKETEESSSQTAGNSENDKSDEDSAAAAD
jgi:hypothetical protein